MGRDGEGRRGRM